MCTTPEPGEHLLLSLRCVDPGPFAGHTTHTPSPAQVRRLKALCHHLLCRCLLTWLPLWPRLQLLPAQLQVLLI